MTNAEAIGMLAYIKAGRPEKEVEALDLAIRALEDSNKPRGCYPIKITDPGLHYRTKGGYYDPTRHLLFTAFIAGELAEQLGIKWQREEEQHGPQ